MHDTKQIQSYINNFRRHLSTYLKPGIGLTCTVYPAEASGAILDFRMAAGEANQDAYKEPSATVNDILRLIDQRLVGGNIDSIVFKGTNISMEPDRILLIKGEDDENEWSDQSARHDVERIVTMFPKAG